MTDARSTFAARFVGGTALFLAALLAGCSSGSDERPGRGDELDPVTSPRTRPAVIGTKITPVAPVRPGGPASLSTANREGEAVTESLAFPTGDRATSVLLLEKTFPAQARLGKTYRYDLKVTNLTDHPVAGVVVRERVPELFRVTRARPRRSRASRGSSSAKARP